MTHARLLLLALVGVALPVGLALGVYVASAGSLTAVPAVVEAPRDIARAAATTTQRDQGQPNQGSTTTSGGGRDDDLPGKCDDPEHRLDPDCDPRSADGSSGPGSGGDDDSSDHGSGDDSSGPGSGGDDDSSGHGSGDDD